MAPFYPLIQLLVKVCLQLTSTFLLFFPLPSHYIIILKRDSERTDHHSEANTVSFGVDFIFTLKNTSFTNTVEITCYLLNRTT